MRTEFSYLIMSIVLGASGQLILKLASVSLKTVNLQFSALPHTILKVFTNGWILSGLLLFATSMLIWLKVISTMELSRAYPSVSLSYVIVFIFSILIFKEAITPLKIIGLLSICFGVYLMHQ